LDSRHHSVLTRPKLRQNHLHRGRFCRHRRY
jgi:hypothetical protein